MVTYSVVVRDKKYHENCTVVNLFPNIKTYVRKKNYLIFNDALNQFQKDRQLCYYFESDRLTSTQMLKRCEWCNSINAAMLERQYKRQRQLRRYCGRTVDGTKTRSRRCRTRVLQRLDRVLVVDHLVSCYDVSNNY